MRVLLSLLILFTGIRGSVTLYFSDVACLRRKPVADPNSSNLWSQPSE